MNTVTFLQRTVMTAVMVSLLLLLPTKAHSEVECSINMGFVEGNNNRIKVRCGSTAVGLRFYGYCPEDRTNWVDNGGTDATFVELPGYNLFSKIISIKAGTKIGTVTIHAAMNCGSTISGCTNKQSYKVSKTIEIYDDDDSCSSCGGGGGGDQRAFSMSESDERMWSQRMFGMGDGYAAGEWGPDFRMKFGWGGPGGWGDSGFFRINPGMGTYGLANVQGLGVPYPYRRDLEILSPNNYIQQVKVMQGGVAHIYVVNDYNYEVRFFSSNNVGSKVNGLYQTNGTPFVTYKVANPDSSTTVTNKLRITEVRGSNERVYNYTYNANDSQWTLDMAGIKTILTKLIVTNTTQKIFDRVVVSGNNVLEKSVKTYDNIGGREVLLRIEEGTNVTQTTAYTYYDSSAGDNNTNQLRRVDYPDENWEYFEYERLADPENSNNHIHRAVRKYSPWGSSAPPSIGSAPDPIALKCKVTEYRYVLSNDSSEDGVVEDSTVADFDPFTPRRTSVILPALVSGSWTTQEVSRTYRLLSGDHATNGWITIEKVNPNPTNFVNAEAATTITRYATEDIQASNITNQFVRKLWTIYRDGTASLFSWTNLGAGDRIEWESKGDPGTLDDGTGAPTNIVTGVRIEQTFDLLGRLKSKKHYPIVNLVILTNLLHSETYVYSSSDVTGRSYTMTDLAGHTMSVSFACCGLESIVRKDGSSTSFEYDDLSRQVSKSEYFGGTLGIKTTNILDSVGRVLMTKRIGTNGNTITTLQSKYDPLGRVTDATNALGGITTYYETVVSGERQLVTTYPNGGTITNLYFRDGRLRYLGGTASTSLIENQLTNHLDTFRREIVKEIKLDGNGGTNEAKLSFLDGMGRTYKVMHTNSAAGSPIQTITYNNKGQLTKAVDPDNVTHLSFYDAEGALEYNVVDLDLDGNIDWDSDRITKMVRDLITTTNSVMGEPVQRIRTYIWNDSSTNSTLLRTVETSLNGLKRWEILENGSYDPITKTEQTIPDTNGVYTITVTRPDSTKSVSTYTYGRLSSTVERDIMGAQLTLTTYAYDEHGRQLSQTDSRNGATVYGYNSADQMSTVTTPTPGGGFAAQTTTTVYNNMGRISTVVQPDLTVVTNEYHTNGLLMKVYGSRNYRVEYKYDAQGRMTNLITWQDFAGSSGSATTKWEYDAYRGWMKKKTYADGCGVDYDYTDGGRLNWRKWARIGSGSNRIQTFYEYGFNDSAANNSHGDLTRVYYSNEVQATPTVTYTLDRLGRRTAVVYNSTTNSLTYNNAGSILTESHSGGPLSGLSIQNEYYDGMKRQNLYLKNGGSTIKTVTYGFDDGGRLETVTDNTDSTVGYSYHANSRLASQMVFKYGGNTNLTTTKKYDFLNRLTQIKSTPSGTNQLPFEFNYVYNDANQRIRTYLNDGSFWEYEYDRLGQAVSGKRYWSDGSPVPGQQFEYGFDDIGNRKTAKWGGDASGQNLRSASYTTLALNIYTNRTNPNTMDVIGIADAASGVSINTSSNEVYRRSQYFQKSISVSNPEWKSISVSTTGGGSASGNVYVPPATEGYVHDLDGNLLSDGRWDYTWDAENRLVKMQSKSTNPDASKLLVNFTYDYMGRRIKKAVWAWNTDYEDYTDLITDNRFLYDGWSLVGEFNSSGTLQRSYTWGTDLSGSEQGAGGVGGLVMFTDHAGGTKHFMAMDGNGNVAALADISGLISGVYEYGPFGEPLRKTGSAATSNRMRWSTKYTDDESDFVYYGYRFYNPSTGRWLNRDGLNEQGGPNLYGFCFNIPIGAIDRLGLSPHLNPGLVLQIPDGDSALIVTVGQQFTHNEKERAAKALCLIRLLLGNIYLPIYTDTYWAKISPYVNGVTGDVDETKPDGEHWVFISRDKWPERESNLLGMKDFGIVLAHEADHYWTHVLDPIPEGRIDVPANAAFRRAQDTKLPGCNYCMKHDPIWPMSRLIHQYACECDINLERK